MVKKFFLIAIVLLLIISVFTACEPFKPIVYSFEWEDNGDMDILKERFLEKLQNADIDCEPYLKDINEDGGFNSIDYLSQKQDTWHPIKHLENVLQMQKAYITPQNKYHNNVEVAKAVKIAMEFWSNNDFYCEWNGWWNGIGIGMYLPDILLCGIGGLSETHQSKLVKSIKNACLQNEKVEKSIKERVVQSTGGNLTDKILLTSKIAVIENDGETLMWIKTLLENELRPFPKYKWPMNKLDAEGIKSDMSFQQHFQLLYFGGYGEVFCDGVNNFLDLSKNTQFVLNSDALNFYTEFILEGMQYAMRGGYRDINASGRGIVRENQLIGIHSQVIDACEILINYPEITKKQALQQLLINRNGDKDLGAGGHKYFWEADYNAFNGEKYAASVRHASKNTRIYEYLNGENPLGYYTGYGATFYQIDGDEYYNALPLFNWNKIPGTTVRQGYLPKFNQNQVYYKTGNNKNVGGLSNGKVGLSAFDLNDNGVRANKAYFMFEDGVVCLGTDITSNKKENVSTTLNQVLLSGEVIANQHNTFTTYLKGHTAVGQYNFVNHDGISYITDNQLSIAVESKVGDWKTISERVGSKSTSGEMLTLEINHGTKPKNQSYNYTLLMGVDVNQTQEYLNDAYLHTLANDNQVQAVWDRKNDITQAVFHKKATLKLNKGITISVDTGCVVIFENSGKVKYLTIASNNGKDKKVNIKINGKSEKLSINAQPLRIAL